MNMSDELLPTYDHVLFNNSALEMCLTQLKFPPVQRFSDEGYMIAIKEALAEEYPLVSTEQGVNLVISPQGINQTPGVSMLRFTSIDSLWSVVLSNESISLETREYTSINEFAVRFASVLRHVDTHFKPRHQLRFGLRYINEFRSPKSDSYQAWADLLNPGILGLGACSVLGDQVEHTIGEVLAQRDDGHLLVRHGFLKGSTVASGPTHPAKTGAFYLLDLDYYDETPVKFEIEAPVERMIHYNDILYRVFRWSIGNGELFQQLRG